MDAALRGPQYTYHIVANHLHAPQDIRYLKPHVVEVMKEEAERKMWDTVAVERK